MRTDVNSAVVALGAPPGACGGQLPARRLLCPLPCAGVLVPEGGAKIGTFKSFIFLKFARYFEF